MADGREQLVIEAAIKDAVTSELGNIRQALGRFVTDAERTFDRAGKAFDQMSSSAKGAAKGTGSLAPELRGVAGTASALSLELLGLVGGFAALTAAAKESTQRAIEFEQSLLPLVLLGQETSASLDSIKSKISEIAAASGKESQEIAQGIAQAFSSGAHDAEAALETVRVALDASLAGLGSVPESVDRLDQVLDSFGLKADEARRVAAQLFVAAREGETSFAGLADAVGRAGVVASTFGISLEETSASIAAMTRHGIGAEQAAAALTQTITRLRDRTSPTSQALRSLGVDLNESAFRAKGLAGVFAEIRAALGGNTDLLAEVFGGGRGAAATLAAVADGGRDVKAVLEEMTTAAEQFGEALDRRAGLSSERLGKVWAGIKADFDAFGTSVLGGVGLAIDQLRGPSILLKQALEALRIEAPAALVALAEPKVGILPPITNQELEGYRRDIEEAVGQGAVGGAELLAKALSSAIEKAKRDAQALAAGIETAVEQNKFGAGIDIEAAKRKLAAIEILANADALAILNAAIGDGTEAFDAQAGQVRVLTGVVGDLRGQIERTFQDLPTAPSIFRVEPSKLQQDIQAALDKLDLQPLPVPLVLAFPPEISSAADTLRGAAGKPEALLGPDEKKAVEAALAKIKEYTDAVRAAGQIEAQLRAQTLDGYDRERAALDANLLALRTTIAELERRGVATERLNELVEQFGAAELARIAAAETKAATAAQEAWNSSLARGKAISDKWARDNAAGQALAGMVGLFALAGRAAAEYAVDLEKSNEALEKQKQLAQELEQRRQAAIGQSQRSAADLRFEEILNAEFERTVALLGEAAIGAEAFRLKLVELTGAALSGGEAFRDGFARGLQDAARVLRDDFTLGAQTARDAILGLRDDSASALFDIIARSEDAGDALAGVGANLGETLATGLFKKAIGGGLGALIPGAEGLLGDQGDSGLGGAAASLTTAGGELLVAARALQGAAGVPGASTAGVGSFPGIGQASDGGAPASGGTASGESQAATQIGAAGVRFGADVAAAGGDFSGAVTNAGASLASSLISSQASAATTEAVTSATLLAAAATGLDISAAALTVAATESGAVLTSAATALIIAAEALSSAAIASTFAEGGVVGGSIVPIQQAALGGYYTKPTFLQVAERPGMRELVAPLENGALRADLERRSDGSVGASVSVRGARVPVAFEGDDMPLGPIGPRGGGGRRGAAARGFGGGGDVYHTTRVASPQVTVNVSSPDPERAGEAVLRELPKIMDGIASAITRGRHQPLIGAIRGVERG